jgi:MFS family permease
LSNLGDSIVFVSSGLLALTLTTDERLLSVVTATLFAAWIVMALPTGVIVDRLDRQRLMTGANLIRVVAAGAIALLTVTDDISIWSLLVLLAVISTCEVIFDSTGQALTTMLVPKRLLARANGLLLTAEVVAGSVIGLAFGAVLFDIDEGLPFAITAMAYAVGAALMLGLTLRYAPEADLTESADASMRSSIRWLWQHPVLRMLAVLTTVAAASYMLTVGIVAKFAIVELGLSPIEFGILISINAIGAATGGITSEQTIARLGPRSALLVSYLTVAAGVIAIGLLDVVWIIAAVYLLIGFSLMLWNVATLTIRHEQIPPDQFGRVNGVYRWLTGISNVVGIIAGGFIAHASSLSAPFIVGGVVMIGFGAVVAIPTWRELRPTG